MDTATKRGGRRLHSALSDRAVKAATAPGRMFDGHGLFLLVTRKFGSNASRYAGAGRNWDSVAIRW